MVYLISASVSLEHPVLVDSGCDTNFIDTELAKRLDLRLLQLGSWAYQTLVLSCWSSVLFCRKEGQDTPSLY